MNPKSTNTDQSFYIAVILYESSSDALDYQPLYQESFVLLKAASLEEAESKALAHARQEEVSYQNENGEIITWALRQIVDVNSVLEDELCDGAELYTRHFRDYAAYRAIEPLLSNGVPLQERS